MDFRDFVTIMVERNASDIYFTVGRPPMYRIEGIVQPIGDTDFTPEDLETLARSIMTEQQQREFAEQREMNLALSYVGLSRFRVNLFRQQSYVGIVVRKINVEIASLDELVLQEGRVAVQMRILQLDNPGVTALRGREPVQ